MIWKSKLLLIPWTVITLFAISTQNFNLFCHDATRILAECPVFSTSHGRDFLHLAIILSHEYNTFEISWNSFPDPIAAPST